MSVALQVSAVDDAVIEELRAITGDDSRVLPNVSSRAFRCARPRAVPGPPLGRAHARRRGAAEDRAGGLGGRQAREPARHPGRPARRRHRALSDGAVPLRGGICVDCKLMNQIHEIDLVDRTVTVGPGINMLKLNEELRKHGVFYPDDPASYPCSLVGGRIGTGGWSLLGSRFGHTRDLVISMEVVLPTGEIVEISEGGGRKLRKSSTGLTLKQLFTGHQGTLGITTEATLELVPRPEVEFAAFFAFDDYMKAWETTGILTKCGLATIAGVVLFDEWKINYLRRDDEAYIPQPESVKAVVAVAMYGRKIEVEPASKEIMRLGRSVGGKYLGDEISAGDWASRHDRYATPLHGRDLDGQAVIMSWHCEDAALNYSVLPPGARGVARDRRPLPRALRDLRRLGHVRLHQRRRISRGPTTSWRSTSASGSSGSTTRTGRRGSTASARSPRSRSSTAGRSRPATARRAPATPSWSRRRWAARGPW